MVGWGEECVSTRPYSSTVSYLLRFLANASKGTASYETASITNFSTLASKIASASTSYKARNSKDSDSDSSSSQSDSSSEEGEADDEVVLEGGDAGVDVAEVEGDAGSTTSNRALFTAEGTVRVRNPKWSPDERFALFYNLQKFSAILKKAGGDKDGKKRGTWETILGMRTQIM